MDILREIGLSEGESAIYLALLKTGTSSVGRLAEVSGQHRTHIYDTLEKLREKGLVSYVKKKNKRFFTASDPETLLNYVEEKKRWIEEKIPELKKLKEITKEKTSIDVYTGAEGMKTIYRDILKQGKEILILGSGGQFREKMPIFADQYFREVQRKKLKHKILFTEGVPVAKNTESKYLPQEYKSPLVTYTYGNKSIISIWGETLIGVMIESEEFAKGFKQQFDLLWNQNVRVFTGNEGFKQSLFEVLKGGRKEVLCTGYDIRLRERYGAEFGDAWQTARIKKEITFRAIIIDTDENRKYNMKRTKKFFYECKYSPKYASGPATYFICGNKMSISYYSTKEVKTILVEDKEIVKQHVEHFEDQWKNAIE